MEQNPNHKSLEEALASLGVHYSVDPEFDKPHPLPSYRLYGVVGGIHPLMSPMAYDPDINWSPEEKEVIAKTMALIAILGVVLFLLLNSESDGRNVSSQVSGVTDAREFFIGPSEMVDPQPDE